MSTPAAVQKSLADMQDQFERLKADGQMNDQTAQLFESMLALMSTVVMLLVEKTTRKGSSNSSLPASKSLDDDTSKRSSGSRSKGPEHRHDQSDNIRTETNFEISQVTQCNQCGHDLTRAKVQDHERRTLIDIVFVTKHHHIDAEIKHCPACNAQNRGAFPDAMPGPLQYGTGIIAYAVHLLTSQMVAVRRTSGLIKATTGRLISEATLMAWVMRVHHALEKWEQQAVDKLLQMPVMHADETSIRINKKTHWLHSYSYDDLVVKFCHSKRGTQAIDEINVIPRYGAGRSKEAGDDDHQKPVLMHDRWASYFKYTDCAHALCGAHLLRDLQFVIDAHNHRWARQMQKLLVAANREVKQTEHKVLTEARYKTVCNRYRTILKHGRNELPPLPERTAKRGRIAKTNAHNLLEAFETYEAEILRFTNNPDCPMSNNLAERSIRMSKVKQKVSGTFRSPEYAAAYCRITSYLQTMSMMGYNPLSAIQIALQNEATDTLKRIG